MADNHDYVALDWVRGEIDSTLTQAQIALEDYVKNPQDSTRLRFCLNYIHQVHGTLQMVEFYGAALLAEEMEHLTQGLLEGNLASMDEAVEVLMRAILQLPNYLSRLQASQSDLPVILLPILNDLRASRGAGLLSDTSLFTPDLGIMNLPADQRLTALLNDPKTVAQIRKLRQLFQVSLVGVIRESEVADNLHKLQKVCERLQFLCQNASFSQLWRLGAAFTEAIAKGEIDLSSGTKNILRSLDSNIKRLIDERANILGKQAPEDLTKHILYYVAKSASESPNLQSIRKDFCLDRALPTDKTINSERQKMSGPDQSAIDSVVGALNEELARVKDQLDLFVRREHKDINELSDLTPGLQQVANTMAVLGLGMPRKLVEDQIGIIEQLISDQQIPADNLLMDIAGALLYVEATLSGYGEEQSQEEASVDDKLLMPKEQIDNAHEAVIREARNGLEQAKTDIVEYIASQWDKSEIEGVPALLQSIRGGLQIIPLKQAAGLLDACSRFISEQLLASEFTPDWQQLDTLADAITSIEYYLERLGEGSRDNDMILDVAEQSLIQLGYPLGAKPAPTPTAPAKASSGAPTQAPTASHEKETDQELIDDEIIEIFVEEAAEVLQTIHQYYPAFQTQPDDASALTELRRAYHTLKGSGRLVGATSIGELAWAVENMLNRVIEGSVSTGLGMFELLENVNNRLPDLIDAYQHGQVVCDVAEYIDAADTLAAARKQAREASKAEAAKQAADAEQANITASADTSSSVKMSTADKTSSHHAPSDNIVAFSPPAAARVPKGTFEDSTNDDMIDNEIIEIFIEEASEVLENIGKYLPAYLASYDNQNALAEIRRGFHTLKGSGRLVGAKVVGEFAWSVENLLNRVIDGTITMSVRVGELINEVVRLIPDLVEDFEKQRAPSHDVSVLMAEANAIANGESFSARDTASQQSAMVNISESPPTQNESSEPCELSVDPVLMDIFRAETESHIESLEAFIREARASAKDRAITDELSRAMHTLKGSANTAAIAPIAEVATPVERFIKEARARGIRVDTTINTMLSDTVGFIRKGLDQLNSTPQAAIEGTEPFLSSLADMSDRLLADANVVQTNAAQPDRTLVNLFLIEGVDILLDAERILNDWNVDHNHTGEVEKLVEELTTLEQGARSAGLVDVAALAGAMEALYEEAVAISPTESYFYALAGRGHEALISMMDEVAAGLATQSQTGLIAEITRLTQDMAAPLQASESDTKALADNVPVLEETLEDFTATDDEQQRFDLDPDLAEVFLEEAEDLLQSSADALLQWSEAPLNLDSVRALQRDIHTIKGGARLAGVAPIGDLAHELESLLEGIVDELIPPAEEACKLTRETHEMLREMLSTLSVSASCADCPDLITALQTYISEHQGSSQLTDTRIDNEQSAIFAEGSEAPVVTDSSHDYDESSSIASLDPELSEIFLEEASDIIHRSGEVLHSWSEDLQNAACLAQLQRDLHTLKGGARMAEISTIGDLAHQLESLFEAINEGQMQPSMAMVSIVYEAHDTLAYMVDCVEKKTPAQPAEALLIRIKQLSDQAKQTSVSAAATTIREQSSAGTEYQDINTSHIKNELYELTELDQELVSLFLEEAQDLIHSTANNLQSWLENIEHVDEVKELQRALHTLKGGARLAEIKPIGDLSHELETLFEGIVEQRFSADKSLSGLLLECHDRIAEMVEKVTDNQPVPAGNDLIARIHHYCRHHDRRHPAKNGLPVTGITENTADASVQSQQNITAIAGETSEAELRVIFLDESREIMDAITDCLDLWKANPDNILPARELSRNLGSLKSAAILASANSVSSLAEALARRMDSIADGLHQVADDMISTIGRAVKYLHRLLDQIEELEEPSVPNELISELELMGAGQLIDRPELHLDIDAEILQVFVEEASELRDGLEKELSDWHRDPRNMAHAGNMARNLHTLKGGARLATLGFIGDLAQEFESVVKAAEEKGNPLTDELTGEINPLFSHLKAELDKVNTFCEKVIAGEQMATATRQTKTSSDNSQTERMLQINREQTASSGQTKDKPATTSGAAKAQPRSAPVESVRVSSPLLDELVNLAGETSITRGLLEQQISDFTFTLEEMQITIDRLRGQLRRMDMETEAQILFSLEKEGGLENEDFDPLEMDRYSSIQQLSRALSESTFDLTDLRETMLNKAKDAETLLLQQSRINTELQEGLMKTRMIPFTSIVPRLRRIVRQISAELGKKVDFEVYNPEGELDRNVLERMIAPLEHMIRNAIGHGIELPEERAKAGKPATGRIELSLAREGGDVILVLSDDGAGIDIDAVRKKAASQGLLDNKTATSDHDVLQYIFHAGFSTAKKVTQISGRGVGMDVVSSEIKQLSGRVSIDSTKGKGTRFVVHLPFTVSVNRALMVNTGEDYYAIPLNTIEGIVRVSTYELEEYYKPNAPLYEYAGQKYQLQYLGSLLKSGHYPKLQGQPLPLPVILVRGAGDQPLALQVDGLMGSREIVVKTLGTQFSKVRGVSGATILGDGNVVVILDLPAMLRSDFSANIMLDEELTKTNETDQDSPTRVMVVDDSVTVRKVTSRLLERNGMEVLLAKDGVDAIALLQDNRPDVMLLDIEMPRMDGFEVASLVRHDERLKDVPIIMITSRTGQKHRDRAMSIGVNEYLGKPFQENNLLETIGRLVD